MKTAYRFLVLLTAVWSTNVAIAGNFDVEIHCFPKRIDQSVRTASDGGVNQTRERWVYDLTLSFTRIGFQPQSLLGESGVEPARRDGDR